MTDKELLELAAKAAGYVYLDNGQAFIDTVFGNIDWNPLLDDGTALRLAVKLRIKFRYNGALGQALAWTGGVGNFEAQANIEECDRGEYAATRRAIVRAAAEIGRGMK